MATKSNKGKEPSNRQKSTGCYELAHIDFVNGMGLNLVADKYKIPLNTVWTWYKRYGWRYDREKHFNKLNSKLFEENAGLACEVLKLGLENAKEFFEFISDKLLELKLLRLEDENEEPFDKYIPSYISLAKLGTYAGNSYKVFNPEFGADVAQKILDSMEKRKKDELGTDTKTANA